MLKPQVVIGDGWAALAAAGYLALSGVEVRWITASGSRLLAPLGSLEWGQGVKVWQNLAIQLGVKCGDLRNGLFVREFRNKAFRLPAWSQAPTLEARIDIQNELLWAAEKRFAGGFEGRFERPVSEIEEEIRSTLNPQNYPNLTRIEGVPVTGFQFDEGQLKAVHLASGERIECNRAIFADQWKTLHAIEGLPKPLSLLRGLEPTGVLQVSFSHQPPLPAGIQESFFAELDPRTESGTKARQKETSQKNSQKNSKQQEALERHFWGHLSSDGSRSLWTLCLASDEVEDNHQIAKRFRRLKTLLDKVFGVTGLIAAEQGKFCATISDEQIRFEDGALFANGDPFREPISLPERSGLTFLTDGYGPSEAFFQAALALGVALESPDPQAENMDLLHSDAI